MWYSWPHNLPFTAGLIPPQQALCLGTCTALAGLTVRRRHYGIEGRRGYTRHRPPQCIGCWSLEVVNSLFLLPETAPGHGARDPAPGLFHVTSYTWTWTPAIGPAWGPTQPTSRESNVLEIARVQMQRDSTWAGKDLLLVISCGKRYQQKQQYLCRVL